VAVSCCEHVNGDLGFRKIWGISTLAEELVSYQKVLRSVELVFKGWLCCASVCWSGLSEDLVSFSLPFLFPVLFSDTADLQQSDSFSNYDAEVCGVVTLVDRLSVTALQLLRT
jgi:hypothetical protein